MALRIPDRVRRIGGGAVLVGAAVTVGVMIGGGNGGSGESPAKNAASDLPLASTTARAVEPQAGSLARKPVPVPPQLRAGGGDTGPHACEAGEAPCEGKAAASSEARARGSPAAAARGAKGRAPARSGGSQAQARGQAEADAETEATPASRVRQLRLTAAIRGRPICCCPRTRGMAER